MLVKVSFSQELFDRLASFLMLEFISRTAKGDQDHDNNSEHYIK